MQTSSAIRPGLGADTSPEVQARSAHARSAPAGAFSQLVESARGQQVDPSLRITARRGDTLSGLVQTAMARLGVAVDERQAFVLANDIAVKNRINDPDLIHPGQTIDFSSLRTQLSVPQGRAPSQGVQRDLSPLPVHRSSFTGTGVPGAPGGPNASAAHFLANRLAPSSQVAGTYPVLERTLQRAVDKGFIPAAERPLVQARILELSRTYSFSPDDFARITLMESDGMNPRASNGNCHGIIQFCEGTNRGAASVDLAGRAQSILGMSVLKQLDLVAKYFEDTGLRHNAARNSLDDLYLTVLTPAARRERNRHDPLNVAGPQAAHLHVNGDQSGPITRTSLVQGLLRNAVERLTGYLGEQRASSPQRQQLAAQGGHELPPRLTP